MRFGIICCVVTYGVLLIVLETRGAPSCDCSNSDERVLSHTIAKEDSKSTAKIEKEDIEDTETESRSKNGLVSGAKTVTQSRELTEEEIEKSRLAEEKKTTKGSEKSETDVTKKKLLSVTEKKSVLVYYMVSYRKLPAKRADEDRVAYYKRVFPIEDNEQVFLRKIFKCYAGEKPCDYLERCEFIFTMVYPEKDCRLNLDYIQVIDHYYTLKYSRKIDETDECYFPRVLKKLPMEDNEHYKKRMKCLVAALDEEDFSHIAFDDSETGYKIGCRKTPAKTHSSPSSSGEIIGQVSLTCKKSKEEKENVDASETSIEQGDKTGVSKEHHENLKKCKTCVETEETTKAYAYRVAYTKLPKKAPGESDECYYKTFFGEYKEGMSENSRNELYLRMLMQYKGENSTDYVKRIDFLFDKVYPCLDVRTNKIIMSLLDHYYQSKYARCEKETENEWFNRVLKKLPCETVQHYNDRVECLKLTFEDVDWSKVTIDSKTATFKLVSEISQTQDCAKKSETTPCIKKKYSQQPGEDTVTYFKRIVKDLTIEEYEKIYKQFPNLGCWSDLKYFNIVKDCYTKIYAKKQCETEDQYYERIVKKYCFETNEQWYKRILMVHETCPNEKLWLDEKYYTKYTKNFYQEWYKKTCADTTDEMYFKRIIDKSCSETDDAYVSRMNFIRKCVCPKLKLWWDDEYSTIVKEYYTLLYTKQKGECDETYYARLFQKEPCDTSNDMYYKRMEIIHQVTVSYPVWSDEKYYEKYTKPLYSSYFKKGDKESCDALLTRIIKLMDGESDQCAVKRVALIKKSTASCGCWTSEHFSKVKCSKSIPSDYLALIKKTFFTTSVQYEKKSSSSASASSSAASSEQDSEVVIKRGGC